jgi:hypothetical protein
LSFSLKFAYSDQLVRVFSEVFYYFHFSYICFSFTEMRTSKAPQK